MITSRKFYSQNYDEMLIQIMLWIEDEGEKKVKEEGGTIKSISHSITHYNSFKNQDPISGYEGSAIIYWKKE